MVTEVLEDERPHARAWRAFQGSSRGVGAREKCSGDDARGEREGLMRVLRPQSSGGSGRARVLRATEEVARREAGMSGAPDRRGQRL